jgi:FkbM family methyltransferase
MDMRIRRLAEVISRGVVLRRHLPAKFGRLPIYASPEAGLRYWGPMSKIDPLLFSMAEELVKPGAIVWDVGANVGLFTFCAAALSGKSGYVLAIEPDVWLAHLITRSSLKIKMDKYSCSEVKVLCVSISDSTRISELQVAERARASNHLVETAGSSQAAGSRYSQPTVSLTLDFLLKYFPAPSILKIDTETHESSVLKGAERILNEVQPTILCEVSKQNSAEVTGLLHTAGYQLYGAETLPHRPTDQAWFQTLAIPPNSG